ncbi:unnamed protein product [Camellia sinensis]
MATAPERSRRLHNFALPRLRWGNQRLLRCMKHVNNTNPDPRKSPQSDFSNEVINRRSSERDSFKRPSSSSSSSPLKPIAGRRTCHTNGIEAVREKLMFDLRVAADKLKVSFIQEKELAPRPWNLRTRRSACKLPNEPQSPMRGFAVPVPAESVEKRDKRAKFSISLLRDEVERDFMAISGMRPPRRPKKRPKLLQKHVDAIFPGLWLTEITPDTYKVPDFAESGKAPILEENNLNRHQKRELQKFCKSPHSCIPLNLRKLVFLGFMLPVLHSYFISVIGHFPFAYGCQERRPFHIRGHA